MLALHPHTATQVVETVHGPMLVCPYDFYLGTALASYGEYGLHEVSLLVGLTKPGWRIVHGGANLGALAIPLARAVGEQGRVLAIEPQRRVYARLLGNLVLAGVIDWVDTHRVALGAEHGQTTIGALPEHGWNNHGGVAIGGPGETVPLVPIDTLVTEWPSVELITLDIEGQEPAALRGAEGTVAAYRPLLYVEADRDQARIDTLAWLDAQGYRVWSHEPPLFNPHNWKRNPTNLYPGVVSMNLLAAPRDLPCPDLITEAAQAGLLRELEG